MPLNINITDTKLLRKPIMLASCKHTGDFKKGYKGRIVEHEGKQAYHLFTSTSPVIGKIPVHTETGLKILKRTQGCKVLGYFK